MRLSATEVETIRSVLRGADPLGKIYLFGSRADDTRRGGDIDLYFETSSPIAFRSRMDLQYRIESACDTRVDLLVKSPGEDDQLIYEIARRGIIL